MSPLESSSTAAMFHEIVAESGNGNEIAERSRERAEELRQMQEQTTREIAETLDPGAQPAQPEWIVRIEGQEGVVRDLPSIADTLEETGRQVREIVGGHSVEEMEGNVAGFAFQGQADSTHIDVAKAIQPGEEGVIDQTALQDVVRHEERHENQASEHNAEAVRIGEEEVTWTDISEADAMSVQDEGTTKNSAEYQSIFARVTGIATKEQISRTAMTGDMLGLARELNREPEAEGAGVAEQLPA